MRPLGKVLSVGVIGVGGWLAGVLSERHLKIRENNRVNFNLSKLVDDKRGIFSSVVQAAAIIPPSSNNEISNIDWGWMESQNLKDQKISQIMRFGFPSLDNLRSFDDFVLAYDRRNRVPLWVFEHLTQSKIKFNPEVDRSKCEFFEDTTIHHFFRSSNSDYKGSGYDRGHLAAAGNHKQNQKDCEETFVLSNMCPQVGKGFNRDAWNRLEKHVRNLTKSYKNLYVCSGPLYLPRKETNGRKYVRYEVIGQNHVAVPTHFFKIVLGECGRSGELDVEAYVMPNEVIDDKIHLSSFQVPIESIERASGLLFFNSINKNMFRVVNGRKLR